MQGCSSSFSPLERLRAAEYNIRTSAKSPDVVIDGMWPSREKPVSGNPVSQDLWQRYNGVRSIYTVRRPNVLSNNKASVAAALAYSCVLSSGVAIAQAPQKSQDSDKPNPQGRVTTQQSVVVEAHLTPEESEEGKINDLYQPIYAMQQHDCRGVPRNSNCMMPAAERRN